MSARALSRVSSYSADGCGIRDDSGAGLDVSVAVAHRDRANRDAEVQVAGKVQVADGAAVEAPPRSVRDRR